MLTVAEWLQYCISGMHYADLSSNLCLLFFFFFFFFFAPDFHPFFADFHNFTIFSAAALLSLFGSAFLLAFDCKIEKS